MTSIRKPIVASKFYPLDPVQLRVMIEGFMQRVSMPVLQEKVIGVVAPHAGYIYSGQCAAYSYQALSSRPFKTLILIGPSHESDSFQFSIGDYEAYQTPLGLATIDSDIVNSLLRYPAFELTKLYHEREHCLEVQVPFIQTIAPEAQIVPILIGKQSLESSQLLAGILSDLLVTRGDECAIVVSTDLSHYYHGTIAETMDKQLSILLQSGDAIALEQAYRHHSVEACGMGGLLALLALKSLLPGSMMQELYYNHSGSISGDYREVVGYLSAALVRNTCS